MENFTVIIRSSINLTSAFEHYCQTLVLKNYSPKTIQTYARHIRIFIDYLAIRNIHIPSDLSASIANDFFNTRSSAVNKFGTQNSAITRSYEFFAVKSFLSFLFEHTYLPNNIASDLLTIKVPNQKIPQNILTQKELTTIFAQPNLNTPLGFRDRTIFETLYACALRSSELCALQITNLNFDQKTLFISAGKGLKDRVVPISNAALDFLERYISSIRPQLISPKFINENTLFLSATGKPLQDAYINENLAMHIQKSCIAKHVSIHTFRHTCATHLLLNDMPLRLLQEFLGHKQLSTTTRYLHLDIQDIHKQYIKFHPRERD